MSLILVVTERYWPEGSGGELATHLILDILRKRFDVIVVTGTKNPSRLSGVKYIYEPLLSKREKPILWLNTLKLIRSQRFQKLLRESDIVYIPRFAFPIIPYAKKLNKKVVVHLHDYIPISYTATVLAPYEEHKHRITLDDIGLECMKSYKHCIGASLLWWLSKLARKWISQADKVVCVSKRQAEIIADQVPELRDKIEVVYNPLPPEIINAEPRKELDDTPTFLYVGGDSYIKGFHILLKAVKELGKQGIGLRIFLVGGYNYSSLRILSELRSKYQSLEIKVLGKVSHKDVIKLHEKSWALIFPSITEEPLPYAVVEAMTLGTIPVASSVGGVPEIVGDCPAKKFLFKPGDVNVLIEKLKILTLQSKENILSLAMECRNHIIEIFNKESIERKIVGVFKELLN
ncbi:MAG: glycosyltransferase family 4 protein [Desulfurococcaceae archaeon]|nr:glycosyltransferase family 4 protein [Desulfurococcaceae archaeon]